MGETYAKDKPQKKPGSSTVNDNSNSSQKKKVASILRGHEAPSYGFGTIGSPPKYSDIKVLDLEKEAETLDKIAQDSSVSVDKRYMAARNLVKIYWELSWRSTEERDADKPDYSNEIWKLYGGPGDPLIGSLEMFGVFRNLFEWEQIVRDIGPESWSNDLVHKAYRTNITKAPRSTNFNKSVEEGREGIGKPKQGKGRDWAPAIKDSSEWAEGNKQRVINKNFQMTADEAIALLGEKNNLSKGENVIKNVLANKKSSLTLDQVKKKIQHYIDNNIVPAFRIAGIDTAQAQAAYLAHWAGETKFSLFTESQNEVFEDDPHNITYNPGYGGAYDYARPEKNRTGNKERDAQVFSEDLASKTYSVDPLGAIESKQAMYGKSQPEAAEIMNKTFIGRGAVQVTLDSNYTMTLIYLEEILKNTENEDDRALIKEALFTIKQDPSQAANPKFAFLFSAAYMHMSGGVKDTANLGSNIPELSIKGNTGNYMSPDQQDLFTWVSGGTNIVKFARESGGSVSASVEEASKIKVRVYNNAFETLQKKLKAP